MSNYWKEDSEAIPAIRFQTADPGAGWTQITDPTELAKEKARRGHDNYQASAKEYWRAVKHVVYEDQLIADTHNWDPPGLNGGDLVRILTNANNIKITGIERPLIGNIEFPRIFGIHNDNSNHNILLRHNDINSLVKNRILLPGNIQLRIPPSGTAHVFYDEIGLRWGIWSVAI